MIGGACYLGILGFRRFYASAQAELDAILREFQCGAQDGPDSGDRVEIAFWVYTGFLNTFAATKVNASVPGARAMEFLARLRGYNFRRGCLGAGALFVPFSTMYHYSRQKRRVQRSLAARLPG